MKKIFTLIAMCLLGVGAMQAVTTDGTPTATLDLQNSATLTNGAFQSDANYLYVHGYCSGKISSGEDWVSCTSAVQASTTIEDADVPTDFKGLSTFSGQSNIIRGISIMTPTNATVRYIVYRVTNCTGVDMLYYSGNAAYKITIEAFEVVNGTRSETAEKSDTPTPTVGNNTVALTELDPAKTYDVKVSSTISSNSICMFEMRFAINQTVAAWNINFVNWAGTNITDGTSTKGCTASASAQYSSTQFYAISCTPSATGSTAYNFDNKFLVAQNTNLVIRKKDVSTIGFYVNTSGNTTYAVRNLKVGDIFYIAADTAATFIETTYVNETPTTYYDFLTFTYDSKEKTLPVKVYQYEVTTAGDQLFTLPNKKLVYLIGVKKEATAQNYKDFEATTTNNGYMTYSQSDETLTNFKIINKSADFEVYFAPTAPSGESVTLTQATSDARVFPGDEGGCIFKAAVGTTFTVVKVSDKKTIHFKDDNENQNMLKAVKSGDSWAAGTNYVLMTDKNGTETKFFNAAGSSDILEQLVGKCYLNVLTTPGAKQSFNIIWGDEETTAINNVDASTGSAQASATRKAMVNGKMFVITANGTYNVAGARIK